MFRNTLQTILVSFTAMMVWRLYSTQFESKQFFADLALAVTIGIITSAAGGRAYNYSSVRITVANWPQFWHEFMEMVNEAGYTPVCQMDENYFFETRWFGTRAHLTLKKVAGNQWEVEFPRGMHKVISNKLGIYSKISLLAAETDQKLHPL